MAKNVGSTFSVGDTTPQVMISIEEDIDDSIYHIVA